MEAHRIGAAAAIHVGEEQSVSGLAAKADMRARKVGRAAGEVVVEIDEEGRDPLAHLQLLGVAGNLRVEIIVVRPEFLARRIMEDLRRLEQGQRQPQRRGNARANRFQNHVHVAKLELDGAVGPRRPHLLRTGGIDHRRGSESGTRAIDQPCAFGGARETFDHPQPWRFRKGALSRSGEQVVEIDPRSYRLPVRLLYRRASSEDEELLPRSLGTVLRGAFEAVECPLPALRPAAAHRFEKRLALERRRIPVGRCGINQPNAFDDLVASPAQQLQGMVDARRLVSGRVAHHGPQDSRGEAKEKRTVPASLARLTGAATAADSAAMEQQFEQALEAFRSGDLDRARALAEAEVAGTSAPQAHHLLGLVHCRLGDPASGIEHLRQAAEAEPGNAAFRIMLMRALVDAGLPSEVLAMPEPPPIRSAAALEEWRARGEAADAAQDHAAAIAAWSKVAVAAPRDWKALGHLANGLMREARWPEAIDALRRAAALNAGEPSIRSMLAASLAAADLHEEALAAIDEYEKVARSPGAGAVARGRSLLALTRFDEAERAYRQALELSPDNAEAFRELGHLLERTSRLGELGQLLADAEAAGVPRERLTYLHAVHAHRERRSEEAHALMVAPEPDDDPVRWQRLKSKIADRLDRPDEAFEAAAEMNRLTRGFDYWRGEAAQYRRRLRGLATVAATAKALPQLPASERRAPGFLVGFPRSGTTLLDTFLMGHPDTAVLEEVHLLGAAEVQIGKLADLPRASRPTLERARAAYFAELDRHVEKGFSGLVVDKLPLNLLGAHFIEALFPGAPIIFAQRHPCDAVLSGFMQSFVMNEAMASFLTIEDAADFYDAVMVNWKAIRENFALNLHVVRYEDLVTDAEAVLRPLIEFLGLPWDGQMLAHTDTARERGAILTPSYDQVTEPLSAGSVGRWKRYREQLEPVLPVLLPWAQWLGYRE